MSVSNQSNASAHLEEIAVERFSDTYQKFMCGEADAEDVILSEEAVEVASNIK